MERSNLKRKRILLCLSTLIVTLCVLLALTACSIFTDTVKGFFKKGEDNAATTTPETGDPSQQGTEQGGDTSGDKIEMKDGYVDEPADPTQSDVVTITSTLTYDKACRQDFALSATHANKTYHSLMGMGLINDGNAARVKQITKDVADGESKVLIDGEYLCGLDVGAYDFYYCVQDKTSGKVSYAPFVLNVTNSDAKPRNVKINYDVDCPNVYVTFRCDCGGKHKVTFAGTTYNNIPAGTGKVHITQSVDKRNQYTATVACLSGKKAETTITKASPAAAAYDGGYLKSIGYGYTFMGHKSDLYIEDDDEAVDALNYLFYSGEEGDSLTVYLANSVYAKIDAKDKNEANSKASAYLSEIQDKAENPWSVSVQLSTSGQVATFTVHFGDVTVLHSGYDDEEHTNADEEVLVHCAELNVRTPGSALPIDGKTKISVRNVKELLAAVEAGYCPIPSDDATLLLYSKAKNFCYTRLTDEMSDWEKLHVIYDYLAGHIDYDYSALNLYSLINDIQGLSLMQAKAKINEALADAETGFSAAMKTAITTARDSSDSTDDLVRNLKVGYLQNLSSFSVEGVFKEDKPTAVCEGISYAFMLLARIEGIECTQITGYATNGGWVAHAWNKVRYEGKWYCVDATWGSIFMGDKKYVCHQYFMIDEATFSKNHLETIDDASAGIGYLALGGKDYYETVQVDDKGHTLCVSNKAGLKAAIKYYIDNGSTFLEFETDAASGYRVTSTSVIEVIGELTGKGCSLNYSAGNVFVATYSLS